MYFYTTAYFKLVKEVFYSKNFLNILYYFAVPKKFFHKISIKRCKQVRYKIAANQSYPPERLSTQLNRCTFNSANKIFFRVKKDPPPKFFLGAKTPPHSTVMRRVHSLLVKFLTCLRKLSAATKTKEQICA